MRVLAFAAVSALACRPEIPPSAGVVVPHAEAESPTDPAPAAPEPSAPDESGQPGTAPARAEPPPLPASLEYAEKVTYGGPRMKIRSRVYTGPQPKSVMLSPDGRELWVCNFGILDTDNVRVYDAATLAPLASIDFAGNAVETLFSRDGTKVWVSNFKRGLIVEIDAKTYAVVRDLEAGNHPKMMVESWDGETLYAANWSSDDVSVVDVETGKERLRHKTGEHPRGIALRRDGTLFVAAMYTHEMHVFPEPNERGGGAGARSFGSCHYPRHLAFSPDEQRLYATCSGSDTLQWYDPDRGKRIGAVRVGDNPRTLALSTDGRWMAVANYRASTVSLIDLVNGDHRIHELAGAKQVVGVAIAVDQTPRVWATSWATRELIELAAK